MYNNQSNYGVPFRDEYESGSNRFVRTFHPVPSEEPTMPSNNSPERSKMLPWYQCSEGQEYQENPELGHSYNKQNDQFENELDYDERDAHYESSSSHHRDPSERSEAEHLEGNTRDFQEGYARQDLDLRVDQEKGGLGSNFERIRIGKDIPDLQIKVKGPIPDNQVVKDVDIFGGFRRTSADPKQETVTSELAFRRDKFYTSQLNFFNPGSGVGSQASTSSFQPEMKIYSSEILKLQNFKEGYALTQLKISDMNKFGERSRETALIDSQIGSNKTLGRRTHSRWEDKVHDALQVVIRDRPQETIQNKPLSHEKSLVISNDRSPVRHRTASRDRSPDKSRQRSRDRSPAKSRARSRDRSPVKSRARSRDRTPDRSRTRSRDRSPDRSRSRSRDRSPDRSRTRSHDRSPDRSRARSRERSSGRSRAKSRDRSPVRSRARSRDRSLSRSKARSRDRSSGRSRARTRDRSPVRSRTRSRDRSPIRSRGRSRDRARSRDRSSSSVKSRTRSRDRSSSPVKSRTRSRDRSSRGKSRTRSHDRSSSPTKSRARCRNRSSSIGSRTRSRDRSSRARSRDKSPGGSPRRSSGKSKRDKDKKGVCDRDRNKRSVEKDLKDSSKMFKMENVPCRVVMIKDVPCHITENDINAEIVKHGIQAIFVKIYKLEGKESSQIYAFVEFKMLSEAVRWMELTEEKIVFERRSTCAIHYSTLTALDTLKRILEKRGQLDWECLTCRSLNLASAMFCVNCKISRGGAEGYEASSHRSNTLLLCNLDVNTTENRVLEVLRAKVPITIHSLRIPREPISKKSLGFCYVVMKNMDEAEKLLSLLNKQSTKIDGKTVYVSYPHKAQGPSKLDSIKAANVALAAANWNKSNQGDSKPLPGGAVFGSHLPIQQTTPKLKTVMVNGEVYAQYPVPDVSKYVYEPKSGYHYDPQTGLYYDANTSFYFNTETRLYMYWDCKYQTYLPSPIQYNEKQNTDASKKQDEKKQKEPDDPKKVTEKVAKHMERWAKIQNQKKVMTTAVAQPAPPVQGQIQETIKGPSEQVEASSLPPERISMFAQRPELIYEAIKEGNLDQAPSHMGKPAGQFGLSLANTNVNTLDSFLHSEKLGLTDWENMLCLLCEREFPCAEALRRHQLLSDLHKSNIEEFLRRQMNPEGEANVSTEDQQNLEAVSREEVVTTGNKVEDRDSMQAKYNKLVALQQNISQNRMLKQLFDDQKRQSLFHNFQTQPASPLEPQGLTPTAPPSQEQPTLATVLASMLMANRPATNNASVLPQGQVTIPQPPPLSTAHASMMVTTQPATSNAPNVPQGQVMVHQQPSVSTAHASMMGAPQSLTSKASKALKGAVKIYHPPPLATALASMKVAPPPPVPKGPVLVFKPPTLDTAMSSRTVATPPGTSSAPATPQSQAILYTDFSMAGVRQQAKQPATTPKSGQKFKKMRCLRCLSPFHKVQKCNMPRAPRALIRNVAQALLNAQIINRTGSENPPE